MISGSSTGIVTGCVHVISEAEVACNCLAGAMLIRKNRFLYRSRFTAFYFESLPKINGEEEEEKTTTYVKDFQAE